METHPLKQQAHKPDSPVIQWLLDSDPSIRWQVMQDLVGAPADEPDLALRILEAVIAAGTDRSDVSGLRSRALELQRHKRLCDHVRQLAEAAEDAIRSENAPHAIALLTEAHELLPSDLAVRDQLDRARAAAIRPRGPAPGLG